MTTALNKFGETAADNIDDISTFLDNTIEVIKMKPVLRGDLLTGFKVCIF